MCDETPNMPPRTSTVSLRGSNFKGGLEVTSVSQIDRKEENEAMQIFCNFGISGNNNYLIHYLLFPPLSHICTK